MGEAEAVEGMPSQGPAGLRVTPPLAPTEPTSQLSTEAASTLNRPLLWAPPEPPAMAMLGPCGSGEVAGQPADELGRVSPGYLRGDADEGRRHFGAEGVEHLASGVAAQQHLHVNAGGLQVLGDDDLGDAEGQVALPAGADGNPLVGVGRGHGEAGIHVVQGAAFASAGVGAALALAELAVAPVPAGGGNPGGEEISPEGQDEIGVLDIEIGEDILLVHVLDGGAVDIVVHGLEGQVLDAGGLGEAGWSASPGGRAWAW